MASVDPLAFSPPPAPTVVARESEPAAPTPALTVSVLTPRGRIASGEDVTLTLLVDAPALVRDVTISLTLPEGLEAVGQRSPAGPVVFVGLDIVRRRGIQVQVRAASVVPASLRLRVEAIAPGLAPEAIRAVGGKLAIYGGRVAKRVSAAGGRAAFGERIALAFAANALARDADIEISAGPTNADPEDDFDPILAFEASQGQAFRAPVTVTLALSGLLSGGAGYGAEPVLRYWKVSEDGGSRSAERVPARFDPSTAELVATLEHFSQYDVVLQTPQDPKPWQMVSNPSTALRAGLGGVNAFRGTSSIAIPIEVPPMQDGLEPRLALQYSSGGAERQTDSPGGSGMGWSLDTPVVRQRVTLNQADWYDGSCPCWRSGTVLNDSNDYTLLIGGQEYALVHLVGGEFVTERYAPLRIWYCASQTSCPAPHAPGPRAYITETFWVWSADGTLSVFGGETETAVRITAGSAGVEHADTLSWHLRYVFAAHRDDPGQAGRWSVKYSYWPLGSYRVLTQVLYGNSLGSAARHTLTLDYVDRYLGMPSKYQPLTITVRAGQTGEVIWRYGLAYGYVADRYVLTQVTKIAADGARMPATTFDYTPVCIDGASPCKTASLMTRVSNGYGGAVEYAFEPGPSANAAERRVMAEATLDGATTTAVRTFEYAQPCKNENAAVCRTYHDFGPSGFLMGYGVVTETARDSANTVLRITAHQYHVDALRLGMEASSVILDPAGAAVTAQTTAWDALDCDAGWPDGSWLVTALTSTSYLAGDASSALFRRTAAQTGLTRTNCARVYQYQEGPAYDKTIWTDRQPPRLLWQMETTNPISRYGILRDPVPGTVPLYLCGFEWVKGQAGDKSAHTFLSRQADCSRPSGSYGGSDATAFRYGVGFAGYIYSTTNGIYSQALASCQKTGDGYHSLAEGTSCPTGTTLMEVLGYASPDTPSAVSLAGVALKAQTVETAESDASGAVRRSAAASVVLSTTARWAVVGISQTVRDGAGNLLDETRAFYDELPTFGAVDRGDLTFVQKRATGNASIDRKLSYDANGSLASEAVYADYGTLGVMTNTSGVLRRTSNVFDAGSGMYVTQQHVFGADTAPQTRTLSYAYFGVGGESVTNTLGARQPVGALKATTDANQAVTLYGYDVFGRLRKVARPGGTLADPSEEWRYFDGIETSRTMTASGFTAGPFVTDHRVRGVAGGGWTSATIAALDRTIYDGLGRVIQTQTRAGQGWQLADCADSPRKSLGEEVIQSTVYDALGRPAIQTVPYTQTQYESCASAGWVNTPYVSMPQTQTQPGGNGLAAVYYSGEALITPVLTRTDAMVNFDWAGASPGAGVPTDRFSARWMGTLQAATSENYTLYATGDDGIRVWVNGRLLIDQWRNQGATEYSAQVALQAGVYNDLRFEYYDHTGNAVAKLEWSSPTIGRQIIPMARLWTARPIMTPTVPYARTAYDALGRVKTETAPDGTQTRHWYVTDTATSYGYTPTNLMLHSVADANNQSKHYVSDAIGRQVKVRELERTVGGTYTLLSETGYAYDAADRLMTVTDAMGNLTTIAYDTLGRKIGMVDPDMGIWSYGYNALGQLITQTDALGQTLVFTYDGLGRMTGKGVAGASPSWLASYLYDQGASGIGRRARMTDTTGYSAWTYDSRGRVIEARKWVNPNLGVYVTTFGYDAANRLISNTLPGGTEVVTTTYDAAGQPFSLFAGGRSLVQSAAYNALGAPTRVSFGNGLDKVNQYFGLDYTAPSWAWSPLMAYGRLRSTCVITASQTCSTDRMDALLNTVFWYDKVGNVTTVRDNVLNSEMLASYDALGRLVTATTVPSLTTMSELAPMTETYAYNAIGNLTGRYGVSATGAITYPAAGSARPHAALETASGNSYSYDANGNMTVRRERLDGIAYVYTQTWTIDNRLAIVTKTDLTGTVLAVTSFYYDGDGVCVRKDDPDGSVLYVGALEQTIGAPGTATVEYFEDITGTATLSGFVAAHGEPVAAGLTRFFTSAPPLPSMGGEPYGLRWQLWLTVPVTDTYTFAVYADDGFTFSGYGLVVSNTTAQVAITKESALSLTLSAGVPYNFSLTYLNYSPTTAGVVQLLWRRAGGSLEIVPVEALHARTRREYFSFGGAVVAMKDGVLASGTVRTLTYLHGDHIGSASLTTDASGQKVSEQRYKPYGEVRWSSGAGMPTDKQFTSQTRLAEGYVGTLYDYVSRAYDPVLGRFVSVDTVVPDMWDPLYLNRYAYVRDNPLLRGDPDGHCPICVTALIGAAVGAVIGAATVALPAMISNIQSGQPLMTNIDPSEVGKAAAVGAVAGLVAGATMGIGTAVLGTGFGATVATGAVSGVIAGQTGKATGNVIEGNEIGSGLFQPEDMLRDGALGALGAAGGYAIGKVAGRLTGAGTVCSFSPDTPVATEAGLIPIAGVITGTRVLAWDETANATGYFPVTNVWVHWDAALVVLIIDGETVTTTPEHPFYTPMHGWLPAGELWVGAGLRRADGGAGIVESTMTWTRTERMWNLTVDVAHTFFVGDGEWLVHNACPLRSNLGLAKGDGMQAHHLIPQELSKHPVVAQAERAGWNQHSAYNGMALPGSAAKAAGSGLPVHNGSHPAYNGLVESRLDSLLGRGLSPAQAKAALWRLSHELRYDIAANGSLP